MPVKIAEKDKTHIRDVFVQTPTTETVKKLAKEYDVAFGDITPVLGKLADGIRYKNQQLQADTNTRQREQRQEKRWEKKDGQKYAEEILPDKTIWRCQGIPVGRNFKRETGTYTEDNWKNVIMPEIHHLENSNIMRLNNTLVKMAHDSGYVSDFSKKHNYPVKLLDTHSRNTMPALASSIIRGIKIKEDVLTVQVSGLSSKCGNRCDGIVNNDGLCSKCGKQFKGDILKRKSKLCNALCGGGFDENRICKKCGKLGGITAGSGRIKTIDGKSFLLVGNELIFEMYIHPDNSEDKYYKNLLEKLEAGLSLSLKIKDERHWGRGFQFYIAGVRDIPETYYSGKPTMLVFCPRIRLGIGAIDCTIYHDCQQIKKMTPYHLNWSILKHLSPEAKSGKIRSWIHKALGEIWIYMERNNLFSHQPVAIWLDVNDDCSNKEVGNWLSQGKFYYALADKLAYRRGRLFKIQYQDQGIIMAELNLDTPLQPA